MRLRGRNHRICCALATLFLAASAGLGAEVIPPDVIAREAVAYSRSLRSAGADVQAWEARRAGADALALPKVELEARLARYEGLEPFAFGPTVIAPEIPTQSAASLRLTQALYTGGRVTSEREAASRALEAARFHRSGTESDVVLEALSAYWAWSKSHFVLEAMDAAVERMEIYDRDMQNLFGAGLATESEALATRVRLERTRLRLEESRRRLSLSLARIAFLTGFRLPEGALPLKPDAVLPQEDPDLESLFGEALKNRPELRARSLETEASRLRVRSARSGLFPSLSLVAAYGIARPNYMIMPPMDRWQDDASLGLFFKWTLFDGAVRARQAEAAALAVRAGAAEDLQADVVRLEVEQARIDLQDAMARVRVADRAEESASLNLESATELWEAGLARQAEVLDAHADLTDSRFEAVAARADMALARAALDRALGRLTPPEP